MQTYLTRHFTEEQAVLIVSKMEQVPYIHHGGKETGFYSKTS